jgi:dihydrofolate synthase/folylpolyglutamate synthase
MSTSYQQTLDYLYTSQPAFHQVGAAAYKPGLDNTLCLMQHLGNPHTQLQAVHIAGTNGKGSTSHLIAAALQAQGYKVGLFTSPHLVDFRERIRINRQMIPEQQVVDFVAHNRPFLDQLRPSFFETTMALAFWYFVQQHVDIAVVEVGLGGRLDSTNVLTPILSVITNIGIDHTEFLGDTLPQIAAEKAGIIKNNVPCVVGEVTEVIYPIFEERARACNIWGEGPETTNCRIWFANQCGYLRKRRLKEAPHCQLVGHYQQNNLQTAFVALQALRNVCGIQLAVLSIADGFAQVCDLTGLRGRWETLSTLPLTICDTGHNSHGIQYVAEQLTSLLAQQRQQSASATLHIILAMVNDKDINQVLALLPEDAVYYFTQPNTPRALPSEQLYTRWKTLHPHHNSAAFYPTATDALTQAQLLAKPTDIIFIGGSNYLVGELLSNYQ